MQRNAAAVLGVGVPLTWCRGGGQRRFTAGRHTGVSRRRTEAREQPVEDQDEDDATHAAAM